MMADRRRFDLSTATPAQLALGAIASSLPVFVWLWLSFQRVLHDPAALATTRPGVMAALSQGILVECLLCLLLGAVLWRRRHDPAPIPRLALAVGLSQGAAWVGLYLMFGHFTSTFTLAGISTMVIGLALLGRQAITFTTVVYVIVALVFQTLVTAGIVPYAPVLTSASYADGVPVAWWHSLSLRMFYLSLAFSVPLMLWAFHRFDSQIEQLETLSRTDGLTRIANRRHFLERLELEIRRAGRYGRPFSIVLCDADHFKRVNDTYGHHAGDRVLRRIGQVLDASLRMPADVAARLGGEEFALLLTECGEPEALGVCERLRRQLAEEVFEADGKRFRVTLSLGVVEGRGESADALLKRVDLQLYRAKSGGRDRVVGTATPETAS